MTPDPLKLELLFVPEATVTMSAHVRHGESVPEKTIVIPAHFLVEEQYKDAFIKHLNDKGVSVHIPTLCITDSNTSYFELVVQSGIPPQEGRLLIATFEPKSN